MKKMKWSVGLLGCVLTIGLMPGPAPAWAQSGAPTASALAAEQSRHVVSLTDLQQDAATPGQNRTANRDTVRDLLKSEPGQKALKSVNVGYEKVDQALGQMSDEDLAKLAARSKQAQADFAAGGLGTTLIVAIVLIIVLAIVLGAVFG